MEIELPHMIDFFGYFSNSNLEKLDKTTVNALQNASYAKQFSSTAHFETIVDGLKSKSRTIDLLPSFIPKLDNVMFVVNELKKNMQFNVQNLQASLDFESPVSIANYYDTKITTFGDFSTSIMMNLIRDSVYKCASSDDSNKLQNWCNTATFYQFCWKAHFRKVFAECLEKHMKQNNTIEFKPAFFERLFAAIHQYPQFDSNSSIAALQDESFVIECANATLQDFETTLNNIVVNAFKELLQAPTLITYMNEQRSKYVNFIRQNQENARKRKLEIDDFDLASFSEILQPLQQCHDQLIKLKHSLDQTSTITNVLDIGTVLLNDNVFKKEYIPNPQFDMCISNCRVNKQLAHNSDCEDEALDMVQCQGFCKKLFHKRCVKGHFDSAGKCKECASTPMKFVPKLEKLDDPKPEARLRIRQPVQYVEASEDEDAISDDDNFVKSKKTTKKRTINQEHHDAPAKKKAKRK